MHGVAGRTAAPRRRSCGNPSCWLPCWAWGNQRLGWGMGGPVGWRDRVHRGPGAARGRGCYQHLRLWLGGGRCVKIKGNRSVGGPRLVRASVEGSKWWRMGVPGKCLPAGELCVECGVVECGARVNATRAQQRALPRQGACGKAPSAYRQPQRAMTTHGGQQTDTFPRAHPTQATGSLHMRVHRQAHR